MNKSVYLKIETYMKSCMRDSAHDRLHVYRVLYSALDIAKDHALDKEVLIASALLHDIARDAQYKNSAVDHAAAGAVMAQRFLVSIGWPQAKADHVRACIATHRFRNDNPPESIEAKIIYDADKLDVIGTLGVARTLMYNAEVNEPIYCVDGSGQVLDGSGDESPSFFREYFYKLKNVHGRLYTRRAREIAEMRVKAAADFYNDIFTTVRDTHRAGMDMLRESLRE